MKIVVIGAGLIGVCSAYFLAREGFEVVVVEKNIEPALSTSFANGGQISVCYSEPWASVSNLHKMLSWIGKPDSPILLKPSFSIDQFIWGLQFLWQCIPFNNRKNIKELIGLSLYSRNAFQELRRDLGEQLSYNQKTNGILTVYSSLNDFNKGQLDANFMSQFGCHRIIKSSEQVYEMAPYLKNSKQQIFGADFSPEDETGDAKLFCDQLTHVCKNMGVQFLFQHEVTALAPYDDDDYIESAIINPLDLNGQRIKDASFSMTANSFVICAASETNRFASALGYYLPIYPVKGYSATLPINQQSLIPDFSITDSSKKMVFTKLGDKLRIAGTAEFNGHNYDENKYRSLMLINRAKDFFSDEAVDFSSPIFWNGLRPTTPNSIPIIKKIWQNVFVNSGHGTLGFTLAPGSGKIITSKIKEFIKG